LKKGGILVEGHRFVCSAVTSVDSDTFAAELVGEFVGLVDSGGGAHCYIQSWSWDFGDGESGTGETVAHTYTTPGNKTVELTVWDDDRPYCCGYEAGCNDKSDSISHTINVLPVSIQTVTSSEDAACVGCDITFTVTTNPSGHESKVSWSGGGDPGTGSGSTFTTHWDTLGTKTVTASICDSSESTQVDIVKVDSVTSNFNVRCIGCNITFTVTTNPSGHEDLVEWSGGGAPSTGSGSTFSTDWDTWGTKTVTASCGDSSESKQVTIVEVYYVTSNKDTACVNCYVEFMAITKPSGYESLVRWSGGQLPSTGSGLIYTTKWGTPGTKTVTASCCDSSKTKDVTIICPSGESTSVMSPPWSGTLARFQARLTPHSVDCSCIRVREYDGGSGIDYCYRAGDEYLGIYPWTDITGSIIWNVDSSNWYGPDLIGWSATYIQYYRSQGRAPCHNVFIQDMRVLDAGCGDRYKQNQLEAHIGTTTLTSKRDGVSTTQTW
jgi:hypothetical protein